MSQVIPTAPLPVHKPLPVARASDCYVCSRRSTCLAGDLDLGKLLDFNRSIVRLSRFDSGDHVFTEGQIFRGIYIVKSGFFQSSVVTREGRMRITGFHVPGEIFGIEAIGKGFHICSTKALNSGVLCLVPLSLLHEDSRLGATLIRRLLDITSAIIARDRELIFSLTNMNASQRTSAFLIDLASRMVHAGFRRDELELYMRRSDIGNYLGLAEETVCRVLTQLHNQEALHVKGRHITGYDLQKLRAIAESLYDIIYRPIHTNHL
jgi:CRP/FNR family transcriptional regulator